MNTRQILAAGLAATLAAGAVGVVRQQRERAAERAGRLPRLGPATATAAPAGQCRTSATLAAWVPDRPVSPAGRVAAFVWAAPLTAVGAVIAAASRGRWRRDEVHGCWVVEGGARGPGRVLARMGVGATGIGQVVLARHEQASPLLLAHEAVHVRQAERLGVLMFPAYLWMLARWGYRDHPLERAARLGAARSTSATADSQGW